MTSLAPIDRLRSWWVGRPYAPKPCGNGGCENSYVPKESEAAGHGGFCSDACAEEHIEATIW